MAQETLQSVLIPDQVVYHTSFRKIFFPAADFKSKSSTIRKLHNPFSLTTFKEQTAKAPLPWQRIRSQIVFSTSSKAKLTSWERLLLRQLTENVTRKSTEICVCHLHYFQSKTEAVKYALFSLNLHSPNSFSLHFFQHLNFFLCLIRI